MGVGGPLFDDDFLRRLETLKLAFRRRVATEPDGAVLTRRRGQALEFQEHRPYVPGDEFRHIDWHLAGRHDDLFVKQFSREEGRAVWLAVDASPSMAFGEPAKLAAALRAAAALGTLALAGGAVVRVARGGPAAGTGAADAAAGLSPAFRGEGMMWPMLEDLARTRSAPGASAAVALASVRRELAGPSSVLLFSDLWGDAEAVEDALRGFAGLGCEQAVLRFLAPDELAPALAGKVVVTDSETGRRHRLYVGDEERAEYRRLLGEDESRWKAACAARQIPYVSASSAVPATELVMVMLREAGVVR